MATAAYGCPNCRSAIRRVPGGLIMAISIAMAVTAAASNPTRVYRAIAACLADHGSAGPTSAFLARSKPRPARARSWSDWADHAGSTAVQMSLDPRAGVSSRSVQAGPAPSSSSPRSRRGTESPTASAQPTWYAAASTAPAGTSGAAATE